MWKYNYKIDILTIVSQFNEYLENSSGSGPPELPHFSYFFISFAESVVAYKYYRPYKGNEYEP